MSILFIQKILPLKLMFLFTTTLFRVQCQQKKITTNIDKSTKAKDKGSITQGQIQYIQIEPQTNEKQWFPVQMSLSFQNSNSFSNQVPRRDKVFLLLYLQNKNDSVETIPNIYNFDLIDSPSLNSRIVSQSVSQSDVSSSATHTNLLKNVRAQKNSISITQKILVSKNQLITAAIYYLNDTQGTSNPNKKSLSVSMNIDFSNVQNQDIQGESIVNLALIIGMVALGLFILILLICVMHFVISKRFSLLSIFNHLQNSNRNSINSARLSRNQNLQDRKLSLPCVSYGFLNHLVFKPLKYFCETNIQQNNSKFIISKKKISQQNEMCSICLEQFSNQSKVRYTYCGHILDSKCLDSWLEKEMSCPMCRQKLQPKDVAQYEDRILQQIVDNAHYQSIIDQQAQTLKKMYKNWKSNKNKSNFIAENTEESLVNNQYYISGKFIENSVIPNISTMVQLQRTNINLKQSIIKRVDQSPSLVLIKPSDQIDLNNVFLNNQQFSVKRFSKNYLFYRCIFLHHKINKNFDKNSDLNLQASDLSVEKDPSVICSSKRQKKQQELQQSSNNKQNIMVNSVQTQPCFVKPYHERQQQLELYINSSIKFNHQQPNSQTKKDNKQQQFSLYFDSDHLSNQIYKQQKSNIQRDLSDYQNSLDKSSQQKSYVHENSKSDKIKKRKNKRLTMRQEMNLLQRQLQQSQKKSQQNQNTIQQNVEFNDKTPSIIVFEQSEDQNIRYAAAPVSIISGQNKSQSSKNCTINKTQVLVLSHHKKQPIFGQQTLKTLPYSICVNHQPPISYRKISEHQQNSKTNQKFNKKKFNFEQV